MNVNDNLTSDPQQQQEQQQEQQQSLPPEQVVETPSAPEQSPSRRKRKSTRKRNRQSENENISVSTSSSNSGQPSVESGKADEQCTTPYNTRGSARNRSTNGSSEVGSDTTNRPLSARSSRQRLPFMDNVAEQENRATSVGDNPAPVAATTPRPSQQSQHNSRHVDSRPATPFSLRKQIELALELSRDCK
ncbi:hypothetical protein TYRP_012432 [Tyrophagus putrescentiae]|nr:hypothetical protein TYRP_012432 [Tyrophagus putrescentiae]